MASFIINHPFFFFFFFSSSFFDPLSNFIPLLQNFVSPTSTLVLILFHEKRDETKNELGMKKKEIVEISRKFTTFNFGKLVDAIFFLSTVRLKIVENEWNDAILDCTRTNIEFQSTLIEKKFWILNQFPSIFFFVSLEDVFIYFPFFFSQNCRHVPPIESSIYPLLPSFPQTWAKVFTWSKVNDEFSLKIDKQLANCATIPFENFPFSFTARVSARLIKPPFTPKNY